jgi:DNA polymerase-3 subunit beta
MEFTIPVETLQSVVSKMSHVIKLASDDVTSMMSIETFDDRVKFCGTGGAVHVVISARNCEIIEKGKILIQLRDISGYVGKFVPLSDGFGTESFKITADDREGFINTKTYFPSGKPSYRKLKFKTFNTGILPSIKEFDDAQLIVNSDILLEGLTKIVYCVDPGEIREAVAGVYIAIDKDKIIFAGTNGIKLAEAKLNIVADIKQSQYVLRFSMANAMKQLLDHNSQVFMKFEGGDAYVKCNDVYISGGLVLNEPYPDYKPALHAYEKVISTPRYDLVDSVSASISALDPEDNYRLTLTFEGNKSTLKNDRVEAVHEFDYQFDHTLDVDVNGSYLLSMLMNFMGENLEICFVDNSKPIIFRSKDNHDHTALLMLLRRR